jgi:hypothetical protein
MNKTKIIYFAKIQLIPNSFVTTTNKSKMILIL